MTNVMIYLFLYSDFIWKMTKGAGEDPPLEIVQGWIRHISDTIGVVIQCTDYIRRLLVGRAKYLRYGLKKKAGGRQRQMLASAEWVFRIPRCSIQVPESIQAENDRLKQVVQVQQGKLHAASHLIRRIQDGTDHVRGRKRSAKHYSKRHEQRLKKARAGDCAVSLAWLEDQGLTPVEVVVRSAETDALQHIRFNQDIVNALGVNDVAIEEDDVDRVNMMLFVKDRFNVSGKAYHEMAKVCKAMPRHYQVKRRISELNCLWHINPTPNGIVGVQQCLEERLVKRVTYLKHTTPPDADFKLSKVVRVKLSGDGTTIGKRLHVVNFAYTLLDEGELAHSYEGNHCLAIFRAPENYTSLKDALADTIVEVSRLEVITVNGEEYNVQYYMGGDWKFLATVTGMYVQCTLQCCHQCGMGK